MARIAVSLFLCLEWSFVFPSSGLSLERLPFAFIPWCLLATKHHGRQSERRQAVHLDGCVYLPDECGDCPAYLGDPFDSQESPAA